MSATIHVFEYQWWRLKEGLTHREVEGVPMPQLTAAKEGAYLYWRSYWYRRVVDKKNHLTTVAIDPIKVPKEIRTMALLLA